MSPSIALIHWMLSIAFENSVDTYFCFYCTKLFFIVMVNMVGGETSGIFSDAFALSWTTFSTVSLKCMFFKIFPLNDFILCERSTIVISTQHILHEIMSAVGRIWEHLSSSEPRK